VQSLVFLQLESGVFGSSRFPEKLECPSDLVRLVFGFCLEVCFVLPSRRGFLGALFFSISMLDLSGFDVYLDSNSYIFFFIVIFILENDSIET
jgi:hypothetical protein